MYTTGYAMKKETQDPIPRSEKYIKSIKQQFDNVSTSGNPWFLDEMFVGKALIIWQITEGTNIHSAASELVEAINTGVHRDTFEIWNADMPRINAAIGEVENQIAIAQAAIEATKPQPQPFKSTLFPGFGGNVGNS